MEEFVACFAEVVYGPAPNLDPVCRAYKHLFSNGI